MGVPKFYGLWLSRQPFAIEIIDRNIPADTTNFLMDTNSVIYKTGSIVYLTGDNIDWRDPRIQARLKWIKESKIETLEAEHFAAIGNELNKLLNSVSIGIQRQGQDQYSKHVVGRALDVFGLALDGVAPQAKMAHQRQRRWINSKEKDTSDRRFVTAAITPGTEFMQKLNAYLNTWIQLNRKSLGKKVIYSSHLVPGEAEHKIMDYLRDGQISTQGATVIHGMDTDLIMLALLSKHPRLYLWREDINVVLNIDQLRSHLNALMNNESMNRENINRENGHRDFVFIMFFLGNDFLPSQPSLDDYETTINKLIDIYKVNNMQLIDDNGPIWPNILSYLEKVKEIEPGLIEHESQRTFKFNSPIYEYANKIIQISVPKAPGDPYSRSERRKIFDWDRFRSAWYSYALGTRGDSYYINSILSQNVFEITPQRIGQMAFDYLIGLSWIYAYYTQGLKGINNRWNYPYYKPALFSDLYDVLKEFIDSKMDITGWQNKGEPMLSSVHQLLTVIPPKYNHLVPNEVRMLMTPDSPIADYYPADFVIERMGINEEYRGHALLPFVNPYRIIDAVNMFVQFDSTSAQKFLPEADIIDDMEPAKFEAICLQQNIQTFVQSTRPEARDERKQGFVPRFERGTGERGFGRGRGGRGQGEGGFERHRGQGGFERRGGRGQGDRGFGRGVRGQGERGFGRGGRGQGERGFGRGGRGQGERGFGRGGRGQERFERRGGQGERGFGRGGRGQGERGSQRSYIPTKQEVLGPPPGLILPKQQ